jgi:ureidoacrylate peracid hydrolase
MGVTTCVVSGVTTCVCVSTTVRGGVEHNYRMILVKDAVAEVSRHTHEAELETIDRLFADVKTTAEVVTMLTEVATISADHEVFTDGGK